ncbi:MAG: outer membrane protein assembly factor BamA [Candidatus Omnitrophota bacterium]
MRRLHIVLLAFFLLSVITLPVLAQQEGREPSSEQSPSSSPSAPTQRQAKLVTALEIKGNKNISTNTVISKMKTRVGSPYQENVVSDDLKRLYILGFFSDIKIDTRDYKDGIKIIVNVVERPTIEKITFSGMNRITTAEKKLKEQLKSKEAQYLDYPSLAEDIQILKKMYEKIGFSQAQIDYKVDINKETNKANIQFNVIEGKKIRIKDIYVKGNTAFSENRILKLIKTRRAWFFNAGVLKEDVLKEDVERIKAFYRRSGFTDVAADYEVKPDAKKPFFLYITFNIQEGKKYLVGNITVTGNKDMTLKDILAELKECVPGKVYSEEALKTDVAGIQTLYFNRGYISARVQEATSVNPQTGRVDIGYSIVENEVVYVSKINVRGNIKTKDVVIRREMRIHPGDKFDGEKLRRSKERLQNLGFFEEVSYDTEDTSTPDKKNLVVEVKESKTGAFSFGGGYSTVDSVVGFIEVEQKNFDWRNWPYFTGAGQNLKFRAAFGTVTNGLDLSFTEPWLFDYPISFGFDAYQQHHRRDTDVGYAYDENIIGGDLRLGKELSEYMRGDLTYRIDQVNIKSVSDDASADLKAEVGKNVISSLTPAITFDNRDNVFDTRKGNLVTASLQGAGIGGDKEFWKLYTRLSHYIPLLRNSSLEIRARVGLADPFGNTTRVPIYERFFAGGAYTIRGYEERAIGPIDSSSRDPVGGESMFVGNIEYTYPVFNFLKAAVFYDTGNVWEKMGDFFSGALKSGVGIGVRIKTPVGPIMLDYGIPLDKATGQDEKGSGRFHFSASHGF